MCHLPRPTGILGRRNNARVTRQGDVQIGKLRGVLAIGHEVALLRVFDSAEQRQSFAQFGLFHRQTILRQSYGGEYANNEDND